MPRGPKGEKRPADVIGNAVHVMRIATYLHLPLISLAFIELPDADPVAALRTYAM
jgi:hypothetical protein